MPSIRKRGDKYEVQIRRRGYKSITRSFATKADGLAWARGIETRMDRADLPPNTRELKATTFGQLLDRYEREVTPQKRSAEIERYRLRVVRRSYLPSLTLDRIGPEAFAAYRDSRLKDVGPETVRRELGTLHHIFEIARREWGVPLVRNPLSEVRKPPASAGRTRRLGGGEAERLMAAAAECRNKLISPLMICAIATGMRRGELLAARWEHLDLKRRLLFLPHTKNGQPRYVPLSTQALAAIEAARGYDPQRIFPLVPNAVKLAWKRLVQRAGLEGLRFHDLRHEAVSRLFELGLSVPEVAFISGHRDLKMLARYAHAQLDKVLAKIDANAGLVPARSPNTHDV